MEPRPLQLPQPGDLVDRYELLFELGRGGMAAVYAARRSGPGGFDKLVALKLLLPHLASDERFRELFLNEARLAAQLEHPNVVSVFDLAEHAGAPCLVMELVRGQSLRRVLERLQAPEPRLRFGVKVAMAVAAGLHAAHSASDASGAALGIVHRDVSPENVLVGYDGRVKVADFGIAKARASAPTTRTGEVRGKLGYLSPEQVTRNAPIGPQSDIWALGVMLYEIAYRRHPFLGETEGETLWNVTSRSPSFHDDSEPHPALRQLIERCLARDLMLRPGSAAELRDELLKLANQLGASELDLGLELSSAFAAERAAEAARLSSLSSQSRAPAPAPASISAPAPARDELSSGAMPAPAQSPALTPPGLVNTTALATTATRRRRWPLLLAAGGSALVFGWVVTGSRSSAKLPSSQSPSSLEATRPGTPPQPAPAAVTSVTLAPAAALAVPSTNAVQATRESIPSPLGRLPKRAPVASAAPSLSPLLANPYP